ncbi:MAG: ROK family protein [Mariprofundaceae bacterium]
MSQTHSQEVVLAADIGGTNIRAAIVNQQGQVLHEQRTQANLSQPDMTEGDVIEILTHFFKPMIEKTPSIQALGLGFPGFFIGDSGILDSSPNLPQLQQFKLSESLGKTLCLAVSAQNDALCAAIGEQCFGAAKAIPNLLHITLGTGVGAGLILKHKPYTGEGGMAMEFGHLCVDYKQDARRCGCHNFGCIEAYASASAVMAQYTKESGKKLNTQEIYQLACQADSLAISCLDDAGHHLGLAIAEAIKLLDIHTVTISGGLTGAWKYLYPAIMQSMNQRLIQPLRGKIKVLPSSLNDHAGILGAAHLAFQA